MNAEEYFSTTPPPANLESVKASVAEFVSYNKTLKRRVVLVSSGGTTVPLENQTVRFLDNFSAGTRGAASAEYFIESGYAVIFLHRQFSLEPYTRKYTHSRNCFLDLLVQNDQGRLCVVDDHQNEMAQMYLKYQSAKKNRLLIKIDFTTVSDYLFLLRGITLAMAPLGSMAMYYLAAAVSDYFIPQSRMYEHKIQSDSGSLTLSLDPVPKIIKPLVSEWADHGFIVSFKLETDEAFLIPKSKRALERYGHQVVVANMLNTRKHIVHLVFTDSSEVIQLSKDEIQQHVEIETHLIARLADLHGAWISRSSSSRL
eukprot:jgi/Hompol1/1488/HPOL_005609-RA